MARRFGRQAALLLLASLPACSMHNFPTIDRFTGPGPDSPLPAQTAQVFVDPNGSFYPSGWRGFFRPERPWKAASLLNQTRAGDPFRTLIERDEPRQLAELRQFAAGAQRVFVLVHGYNNSMKEARLAYEAIEAKLDIGPGDRVVRFYWDGLIGHGIGAGEIWFKAVGYSQVAGVRGLRKVLEQFPDQKLVVITHSRGASVILSALGDPVYNPDFRQKTIDVAASWGDAYRDFLTQKPLPAKGGAIDVLMLAPAVDRVDFCDSREQPLPGERKFHCEKLRAFPARVRTMRYTLNTRDPVLNKGFGLASSFNPTGLGVKDETGVELKKELPILDRYTFSPGMRKHAFRKYVASPTFEKMIADAGVAKRP